ncbi:uncharacterized protein PG986_008554 [Apiospora aurea]|uniref:Uncharacterized protein n=1 Tax=Apiospora aurea TaxID=335848 RepID=A0ABR1QFR6_9PEZI
MQAVGPGRNAADPPNQAQTPVINDATSCACPIPPSGTPVGTLDVTHPGNWWLLVGRCIPGTACRFTAQPARMGGATASAASPEVAIASACDGSTVKLQRKLPSRMALFANPLGSTRPPRHPDLGSSAERSGYTAKALASAFASARRFDRPDEEITCRPRSTGKTPPAPNCTHAALLHWISNIASALDMRGRLPLLGSDISSIRQANDDAKHTPRVRETERARELKDEAARPLLDHKLQQTLDIPASSPTPCSRQDLLSVQGY